MAETYYGTGKRKDAIARVWLVPGGSGQITINEKPLEEYFPRIALQVTARSPLSLLGDVTLDVRATASGGGTSGQAGALRHGIAKALLALNEENRTPLREMGALTRDPRVKERKKYGRKRARRGFQFSKR